MLAQILFKLKSIDFKRLPEGNDLNNHWLDFSLFLLKHATSKGKSHIPPVTVN